MLTVNIYKDWKAGRIAHAVKTVELANGSQGIPSGFDVYTLCGKYEETSKLDFTPRQVDCEACKALLP